MKKRLLKELEKQRFWKIAKKVGFLKLDYEDQHLLIFKIYQIAEEMSSRKMDTTPMIGELVSKYLIED